jgi:DNA adenine methylase
VFLNSDYPANLLFDSNGDLISLYRILRRDGDGFVAKCQELFTVENNTAKRFYELRTEFNEGGAAVRRAALFVFLNRHCYNGLCRYNQKGEFNTPFGRYAKPYFPATEMREFARKLHDAEVAAQDFRASFAKAQRGDLVYCDPPYIPLSATANFTDYASGGFSLKDQADLASCCLAAAQKGATVVISNHDSPVARELYRAASSIIAVQVSRTISCDGENRGKVNELIAVFKPVSTPGPLHKDSHLTGARTLGQPLDKNQGQSRMRTLNNTMRGWLLENHYEDVAALIDDVIEKWERTSTRTRRNWWDVLAGDKKGNPSVIAGVAFPVLRAARLRKNLAVTANCICRNEAETFPPVRITDRWPTKKNYGS